MILCMNMDLGVPKAKNYALYSSDFDQDTALAFDYKTFIAKQMNSKVLSLINRSISEFDVILELY